MPTAPLRDCLAPGCNQKVKSGRCTQHQQQVRVVERRFQQGKTSYGRPWRRVRDRWLANNPLCVMCETEGKVRVAEEVDHIIPHKGNRAVMYDTTNLQSLCKSHHSQKTMAEIANGTADAHAYVTTGQRQPERHHASTHPTAPTRYVITGAPGSGKTTWVEQRRQPGDMVWDMDVIAEDVCGIGTWPRPGYVLDVLFEMRAALVRALVSAPHITAYIIDSNRQSAVKIALQIGAQVIDMHEHSNNATRYTSGGP